MFSREKKRLIIPEIPKGYDAHPFEVGDEFIMPENLESILNSNGYDYKAYESSFVVPPQVYLKHWFGKRYVPWQALLFDDDLVVHVRDSLNMDESGTVKEISAGNLAYLKLNHCLLYGKLDIVCSNGKDENKVEVEYNTTSHRILEPNLERFLKASWQESRISVRGRDVYERLRDIPTKYRNGVYIYVLQKDEELLDFLFLPKLVRRIGFIKINLTHNIFLAVTDRQLVMVEDDLSPTSTYTWLLTYIPMDNVKGITFEKQKRFTRVLIKVKKDNLVKDLQLIIEDKYLDDVKRFMAFLYQ